MRVFLLSLALLLPLCLLVGSPRAVEAQTVEWQRYYPLEIGNVWEYQRIYRHRVSAARIQGFQRRTVVRDTMLGGEPFKVVVVEEFAPDYLPTGVSRCAVRVIDETGRIEWTNLTGWTGLMGNACDAPEDHEQLDLRAGSPFGSTVFLWYTEYEFESVKLWNYDNETVGDYTMVQDIGFVQWRRDGGFLEDEDLLQLVYAKVGERSYGDRFDSDAWKEFLSFGEGNEWHYSWYSYTGPQSSRAYYRMVATGDTIISQNGKPYNLVVNEQYNEDLELVGMSECGIRLDTATVGGSFKGRVSSIPWSGSFCTPVHSTFDLRMMYDVSNSVVLGVSAVTSVHSIELGQGGHNRETYGRGLGIVKKNVYNDGSGGGWGSSRTLLYAVVDDVTYGAPVVSIKEAPPDAAERALALTTSPNPFRSSTLATLTLRHTDAVHLAVFDALGRRVLTRDLGMLSAGRHTVPLAGAALAPGVYVVRAETASGQQATRRVVHIE